MADRLIAPGAGIAFSGTAPDPLTISIAPGATAAVFVFEQTTPSSEWLVPHNFGNVPVGYLVMAEGVPIDPDFREFSAVRVVVAFGYNETGSVTLLKGN